MNIIITENGAEFYTAAAGSIADVICRNPAAKIGLSTGRTTKYVHQTLVEYCLKERIRCSELKVFGVDEIVNMPRSCRASCWYILLHDVVEPLSIPLQNFIMPDANAADLEEECRLFESRVAADGGPDFIFLGLGENGHLAFNQPGTPFGSHATLSWMDESLRSRLLREYDDVPRDADLGGMTLGIVNIMQCPKLVIAANGSNKASVVRDMICGPVSEMLPASILQLHPDVTVILDQDAAALINTK